MRSSLPQRLRHFGPVAPWSQARRSRGSCAERTRSRPSPRRTFPAGGGRALGSASPALVYAARPPSFSLRRTPEAEDLCAPAREVAETREGGRVRLAWVSARPRTLGHRQARLRVWVRVPGPPSSLVLIPAPPRTRGAMARKFELAGAMRADDSSSEMQVSVRVRTEPRGCHSLRAPLLPGF